MYSLVFRDEPTRQCLLLRLSSFTNVSRKDSLFGTLDALAFRDRVGDFGETTAEFRGLQNSKTADHLPLYRQAEIYAREGY
jgi:hypothetical protein